MPRFLNTSTGEFEWHNHPERIVYAILSHTWRSDKEGGEQSYEDVRALQAGVTDILRKQQAAVLVELKALETLKPSLIPRVSKSFAHSGPTLPCVLSHPKLSDKIKGVCKVAREAGIRLVWNDACCIDKSSSAELSEAINSMYELYRLSQVCYVYLEDVPDGDEPRDEDSRFRWSRWHWRGWTLQELIAPEAVEFLTNTWHLLGTKMGLAVTLEEITGIDFKILTGQTTVHSASVARRMSWASRRETTRIEDRAYSLMGIFGVHLSPIYGEGDNAFLRLQEEIVRTIPDQSIFAWGSSHVPVQVTVSQHDFHVHIRPKLSSYSIRLHFLDNPSLLASGLRAFREGAHITPIAPSALALRLRLKEVPSLHCVFTPHGVRVQLLSLNLASLSVHWAGLGCWDSCSDCLRMKADTLALLQCEDESGSLIALPLRQPRDEAGGSGRGILIGTHIQCNESRHGIQMFSDEVHHPFHTVCLPKVALAEILEHVTPTIIDVCLLRHHSKPASTKLAVESGTGRRYSTFEATWLFFAGNYKQPLDFRIPPRDIEALGILGFVVETPLQVRFVKTDKSKSLIVDTSLTFNGGNIPSRTKECPQTIQLTLTLINVPMEGINGIRCMTAQFCIVNSIGVPAGDFPCPTSPPTIPSPEEVNNPCYVMTRAPCVDGNKDFSPEIAINRYSGNRVIADAGFTIYADPDWEKEACTVRFLRVSLAFSNALGYVATSGDDPERLIYLSIQLSEKYRHTRRIADRTLPGDLPPSQTAGDICEPATPSSDNDGTSQDAEVLKVTDPPENSVPLSEASSQTPLSDSNEPTAPENGESSRRTPPDQHADPERTDKPHDDGAAEAPGTAIQPASFPSDVRPRRASSERPAAELEGRASCRTSLSSVSSDRQDQALPISGDPDPDNVHEGGERSDVGHSERDALREEVSTLKAQVADLTSKMSSQMEEIRARFNAEPSPVPAAGTDRRERPSRRLVFSKARRKGLCVIQ
ncbi:hypothetical protein VTO73DRAFT_2618 [Trametes versicolor]